MANNTSERGDYCPLVAIVNERGQTEVSLDTLSATYELLTDQQIAYDTFQITDSEAQQLDAVAYRYYGDSQLWWLIAAFNFIIDPYTEVVPGLKVRVPRLDEVMIYLTRDDSANRNQSSTNVVGATGVI